MATLIIPLDEVITLLRTNVQLPPAIRSMESTAAGLRLGVRVAAMLPQTFVTVRFVRYERPTAVFAIDGLPGFVRLDTLLQLPQGIAVTGSRLTVQTDVLLATQLHLRGLAVQSVSWDNRAFRIETAAGR